MHLRRSAAITGFAEMHSMRHPGGLDALAIAARLAAQAVADADCTLVRFRPREAPAAERAGE